MMCVCNLEDHLVKFGLGSGAIARGHPRYFPQGGMETIANSRQHTPADNVHKNQMGDFGEGDEITFI